MSQKNQLYAAMKEAIARRPGSHATREAYECTARGFVRFAVAEGYSHLRSVGAISGRHLRAFIGHELAAGLDVATCQNKASHLRGILDSGGREDVARAPELSNEVLGISGRVRIGSKTAMSDESLREFCTRAVGLKRPGMAAMLELHFWLGLRGNEGVHARSDTLERWQRELIAEGRIRVVAGAKGGKSRDVHIHPENREAALEAIRRARQIAGRQGTFLVVRRGDKSAGGLKPARAIFHAFCNRAGIQPHSARYAFAKRQLAGYLLAGYSQREALIRVSHDLGHGDGRGRWVKSVYTK